MKTDCFVQLQQRVPLLCELENESYGRLGSYRHHLVATHFFLLFNIVSECQGFDTKW